MLRIIGKPEETFFTKVIHKSSDAKPVQMCWVIKHLEIHRRMIDEIPYSQPVGYAMDSAAQSADFVCVGISGICRREHETKIDLVSTGDCYDFFYGSNFL